MRRGKALTGGAMLMESIAELSAEGIEKLASKRIPELVMEARRLHQLIKDAEARLEIYKGKLRWEAEKDLLNANAFKPGACYLFEEGAEVMFPERQFVRSIWFDDSGEALTKDGKEVRKLGKLKRICGKHFKALFMAQFMPSKFLVEKGSVLLTKAKFARLLAAVCVKATPRVSFK